MRFCLLAIVAMSVGCTQQRTIAGLHDIREAAEATERGWASADATAPAIRLRAEGLLHLHGVDCPEEDGLWYPDDGGEQ